jgi:hypothetical protein
MCGVGAQVRCFESAQSVSRYIRCGQHKWTHNNMQQAVRDVSFDTRHDYVLSIPRLVAISRRITAHCLDHEISETSQLLSTYADRSYPSVASADCPKYDHRKYWEIRYALTMPYTARIQATLKTVSQATDTEIIENAYPLINNWLISYQTHMRTTGPSSDTSKCHTVTKFDHCSRREIIKSNHLHAREESKHQYRFTPSKPSKQRREEDNHSGYIGTNHSI